MGLTGKHSSDYNLCSAALVGHASFACLSVLAYVFANERVLFADTAFLLYRLVQEGGFITYNQRYAAALPQLLPKLGIWMGLPLWMLVKLTSVCFVLLQWALFALMLHALKHVQAAMAWVLVSTVLLTQGFYWPQSELQQGLPAMLLLFALVGRRDMFKRRVVFWLLACMLAAAVVFYHPLLIFGYTFVCAYLYLCGKAAQRRTVLITFAVGAAVYLLRLLTISGNPYEASKFGALKHINLQKLLHYFELPSVTFFLANLTHNYLTYLVLLLSVSVFLAWRKRFGALALVWCFTLGYWMFLSLSFPNEPGHRLFYRENMLRILSLFVCVPFAWELLPGIKKRAWRAVFVLALLGLNLGVIYQSRRPFVERLAWLQQAVGNAGHLPENAFFVRSEQLPPLLAETWGLPYESLLLTCMGKPGKLASMAVYDPGSPAHKKALEKPGYFIQPWGVGKCTDLNRPYFGHQCTVYRILDLP